MTDTQRDYEVKIEKNDGSFTMSYKWQVFVSYPDLKTSIFREGRRTDYGFSATKNLALKAAKRSIKKQEIHWGKSSKYNGTFTVSHTGTDWEIKPSASTTSTTSRSVAPLCHNHEVDTEEIVSTERERIISEIQQYVDDFTNDESFEQDYGNGWRDALNHAISLINENEEDEDEDDDEGLTMHTLGGSYVRTKGKRVETT